jgi:hypothetical protein
MKLAKYLKKPTSSRKIDKKVIDKNNNNILIGLIALSSNKPLKTSSKETQLKISIAAAPTRQTIQYVLISNFFILIFGKNNIEQISVTHVNNAITIDAIISFPFYPKMIILPT